MSIYAQVAGTFALALEDYYGVISTASNGGICTIASPSNAIVLTEVGET